MEKAKVLVVEDDASVRRVVARFLVQLGHDVSQVSDGADALPMLRERVYDLVVSDVDMPRMGGRNLLRSAQKEGIPSRFLFMSGGQTGADVIGLVQDGEVVLRKPFDKAELTEAVRGVLTGPAKVDKVDK